MRLLVTGSLLHILVLTSSALYAEQPGQAPTAAAGQPGSEFVPSAGYVRTLQLLDLQRSTKALSFDFAPSLVNPISGTRLIPVICVQFPNRGPKFTTSQHQSVLFDPAGVRPNPPLRTLTQYYRDISLGRFEPNGEVFGWYMMPQNDSYYEGGNNGQNQRLGELLQTSLGLADAGTDFGRFDNDGPDGNPNSGDDDGIVDTVFLIHPEVGGEIGNGVNGNIWSHSFQYSKFAAHNGQPYVTNDRRLNSAGQQLSNPDGTPAFVRVEDYTIQPGLSPRSTPNVPQIIEIGVFCHEYGHALGLPDLYDRPDTGANSSGIGNYCLMAGGSYGADGSHSETPVSMSAWCKAALGWAEIRRITANGTIALEPVQASNRIYNFDVPGTSGREFFLIEFRDPTWAPNSTTQINWDAGFNPGGLAIWHVDEQVGRTSANWPFAPAGQGQNDSPSLPGNPLPSFRNPHALVALMQADRQLHLERGQGRGDTGDLHGSGSVFADDSTCQCGSRGYATGQPTGFSLRNINLATLSATASVSEMPTGAPPSPSPVVLAAAAPGGAQAADDGAVAAAHAEFQPLARKLAFEGAAGLSDSDRQKIAAATESQLRSTFTNPQLQQARKIAAAERTVVIDKEFSPSTPVQKAAKQLVVQGEARSAVLTAAPGDRADRLMNLTVPIGNRSAVEDAAYRVAQDQAVRTLIGPDVSLGEAQPQGLTDGSGMVYMHQVVEVAGKRVSLSCHGVTFRYKDQKLTELNIDVVPASQLQVTGDPDALSEGEARQLLSDKTGMPENRIQDVKRCVYLVNGQPRQARSAIRLKVDSGGQRPPIEIFIDQQTKQVLQLK